jgi:predicted nucleotidyltransferase component of viral defense system
MRKFLALDPETRRQAIEQTALRKRMAAVAVEKDFWVTWTLGQLFSMPEVGSSLTFKGGTSLSKAWGLIERFSEDIDLVIDKPWLGIGPEDDPERAPSPSQLKRRLKVVEDRTISRIAEVFLPQLRGIMAPCLDGFQWSLELDVADPQTLLFSYPRLIQGEVAYLRGDVKIELGTRSDPTPTRAMAVRAEVAAAFPQAFENPEITLRVLEPVRTFLEKAALLHETGVKLAQGKPRQAKLARHYYDLAKLIEAGIGKQALEDLDLFRRVVASRMIYFRITGLDYDSMLQDGLRLVPLESFEGEWARDYEAMGREMFYGAPPRWHEVLDAIHGWEAAFNQRLGA